MFKSKLSKYSVIRRTEQLDQPDTGKFYEGSTPAPGRGSGCHCFLHSGIVSGRCTLRCFSTSSCPQKEKCRQKKKKKTLDKY